jgi:hypothetical protein
MKRTWLALSLGFVLVSIVACGGSDDKPKASTTAAASSAATYTLTGFADHTAPGNFAPQDVTATGGTLKSCNPAKLYAFVNFANVAQPKPFAGSWTLNGTALNSQTFTQTATNGTSFFEVQNTPQPLVAGAYRFALAVDGKVVTQGNFTLSC